jgi:nucleotide-binding universal stress UspA family protein
MLYTIKKILVCTDLSEQSDVVLKTAEKLRKRINAEMDVLYVTDIGLQLKIASSGTSNETFYDSIVGNMVRDLRENLHNQVKRTEVFANSIIVEGNVVQEINNIINEGEIKYDLLIIGHNSKTGLFHHLIGSVARKLVSSVSIPALVIKKEIDFNLLSGLIDDEGPSNWMITSTFDFYRALKFRNIEFISLWFDLPEPFGQQGKGSKYPEQISEDVKYFTHEDENPSVKVSPTRELPVSNKIIEMLEESKSDLAVLKRNKGKKLNKMIVGSETMRLLEFENLNLLVLPV